MLGVVKVTTEVYHCPQTYVKIARMIQTALSVADDSLVTEMIHSLNAVLWRGESHVVS